MDGPDVAHPSPGGPPLAAPPRRNAGVRTDPDRVVPDGVDASRPRAGRPGGTLAGPTLELARPAPEDLSVEQVADLLEQVQLAGVEVAVAALDDLLAQLRPATAMRRTLTAVPSVTRRQATLLLAARRTGQVAL